MGAYLERLCIFICLGDLLGHFLPSKQFTGLYRMVVGTLVLLILLEPLGKNISEIIREKGQSWEEAFADIASGQSKLWGMDRETLEKETGKVADAYLSGMSEEELKQELADHGWGIPKEDIEENSLGESRK
ncbi:MAG: hypothetical protein J1E61_07890 [Lachnospiraceae bacterium]|nr:hypothetical protein [Lachnospiraceae bacterium]